jgi:hypothetical protein
VEMSFLGLLDLLRSCGHTLELGNIVVLLGFRLSLESSRVLVLQLRLFI